MPQTKLANLVNPQVMQDMVSAKLPKLIRFAPLAYMERKLEGQPGNTLIVPKYTYIGDAADIAEGQAIPLDQLGTTTEQMTIKKAGKGVEITDEAMLSALGDPQQEAVNQIALAIANKVDNDALETLKTATQVVAKAPTTVDALQEGLDLFNDEDDATYVLITSPKNAALLRKDAGKNWLNGTEVGADAVISGTMGEVNGVQIVRSKKLTDKEGILVKRSATETDTEDNAKYGALVIALKRDVMIETDRDIVKNTNVITGNEHYGTYLYDDTKVVKFTEA